MPTAARSMRILLMSLHVWWLTMIGMKGYTSEITGDVEMVTSTCWHSLNWQKTFWFTLWCCSAGIFAMSS
jgi:hypothetical protein